MKKVIYDIGSNNGDDIPYYLLKSDLVVAIEANPLLCQGIKERFPEALASGKLVIENCVVDIAPGQPAVPFYVHLTSHVLSQFPRPTDEFIDQFFEVPLPSRNIFDILAQHGDPYYIKIDIEHFDHVLLRALFENGVYPPYISAESHSSQIFALMVALGRYTAFKVVDGYQVAQKYQNAVIQTEEGPVQYSFPHHSAGPMGEDIPGPWMTPDNLFSSLGLAGLGWKDIHASRLDEADPAYLPPRQLQVHMMF